MENKPAPQSIHCPHLRVFQAVLVIFLVLITLKILLTADALEINLLDTSFDNILKYIFSFEALIVLFFILTLAMIGRYLQNFDLTYSGYMLYIAALCMLLEGISNVYSFHIVRDNLGEMSNMIELDGEEIFNKFAITSREVMILSTICRLSILLFIIMFTVVGFNLLFTEKDYVGGLNMLGIAFVVYALASSFVFVISYYISDVSESIKTALIVFKQIAAILIPISMLYVTGKAVGYNGAAKANRNL